MIAMPNAGGIRPETGMKIRKVMAAAARARS